MNIKLILFLDIEIHQKNPIQKKLKILEDEIKIIEDTNLRFKEENETLKTDINILNDKISNLENNESKRISNDTLIGKKIDDQPADNIANQIKNQLKNINQIKTNPIKNLSKENQSLKIEITSFQDLINLANKEKEIELKFDLERNVKLVSFNKGKIDISFNEKLNKNFIKNLTEKLLSWTGERWIISLSKNNEAKSIYEKNLEDKDNMIEEFRKSKVAQDLQKAFPDAKLIDLTEEE